MDGIEVDIIDPLQIGEERLSRTPGFHSPKKV